MHPALKVIPSLFLSLAIITGCAGEAAPTPSSSTAGTAALTTGGAVVTKPAATAALSTTAQTDAPIVFADPVFRKLLEAELGRSDLTAADLDAYTRVVIGGDHFISLSGGEIPEKSIILYFGTEVEMAGVRYKGYGTMKTLADLSHFRNLDQLKVTLQPDLDYSTIPSELLTKLKVAHFSQSRLKDISFLKGATGLVSLNLAFGEVADLSPLTGCSNLMYLSGSDNPIADLTPLAGLTKLSAIRLHSGRIKDLTPLAGLSELEELELFNNQVEDLTPLTGLLKLEKLEIIDNDIKDVSPLKELPALQSVMLNGNPVENIEVLDRVPGVQFDR